MKSQLIKSLLLLIGSAFASMTQAGDSRIYWPQDYHRAVAKWQEIVPMKNPPTSRPAGSKPPFWDLKWHVYLEGGQIVGEATPDHVENHAPLPPFDPVWRGHEWSSDTWVAVPVDNGWIVAFDVGEFGAGVVWFNSDGSQQHEISRDYVQAFLATPDGLFGQGGLAHMATNSGSLYRFNRTADGQWDIKELCDLRSAYCPIFWLGNHTLLARINQSLYSYSPSQGLRELSTKALPELVKLRVEETKLYSGGRYAATADKVYLGSGWFVTEIDLHTLAKRFLIPDSRFTNDELRWYVSVFQKLD
jgi:hypothetical protein